jgi:hypothetical protein
MSANNAADGMCSRCKESTHGAIEIDPLWLALCENAPDDRVELVGEMLAGRKTGVWWR